jgi:hypothetical protein
VIDGHVIPNHVIFLRPSELKKEYETTALSSSLPVFIEFDRPETNGDGRCMMIHYDNCNKYLNLRTNSLFHSFLLSGVVRSDTRSSDGDALHRKGVVQTEVVRGNIPVSNGVVHLISKPLVLIDLTVYKTLQVN